MNVHFAFFENDSKVTEISFRKLKTTHIKEYKIVKEFLHEKIVAGIRLVS